MIQAADGSFYGRTYTGRPTGGGTVFRLTPVVNQAPIANGQSTATLEDTVKGITLTASDADGDTLTFTVVTGPAHGVLTGSAPNVTYTPAANYNGADNFTFKANDRTVDSNTATVSIAVTAVILTLLALLTEQTTSLRLFRSDAENAAGVHTGIFIVGDRPSRTSVGVYAYLVQT